MKESKYNSLKEEKFKLKNMLEQLRSKMEEKDKPTEWQPDSVPALLYNAFVMGCSYNEFKSLYNEIKVEEIKECQRKN